MQSQGQKISVVENRNYAILFLTDNNTSIQMHCSVSEDGEVRFDRTDTDQDRVQALSTSSAWQQAIRSFHRVSAIPYTATGTYTPPWGDIPIHLREIESANDECKLQFIEPDGEMKVIRVKLTDMSAGGGSVPGFDITGDKTVISRIDPRDMYRVTKDFLDAIHEI